MALTKPSQPIEPEVSFVVAFLSNADDARALVSPIVSVAETKKISVTEIIAFQLNSILNGIKCGRAINELSVIAVKSIIPIHVATM